jgi:hypothetical protein
MTPLHCLASVYSMAEASSKSVLFSMLKGVDSWMTPMIGADMPVKASSVRSMDIVETLAPITVQVRGSLGIGAMMIIWSDDSNNGDK